MCEKETIDDSQSNIDIENDDGDGDSSSGGELHIDESRELQHHRQSQQQYMENHKARILTEYNNLLLNSGAAAAVASGISGKGDKNYFNYSKISKGYFTHLQQQQKNMEILRQNRTDVFVVNNNSGSNNHNNNNREGVKNNNVSASFSDDGGEIRVKNEIARPDSTGHSEGYLFKRESGLQGSTGCEEKKPARLYQVRVLAPTNVTISNVSTQMKVNSPMASYSDCSQIHLDPRIAFPNSDCVTQYLRKWSPT